MQPVSINTPAFARLLCLLRASSLSLLTVRRGAGLDLPDLLALVCCPCDRVLGPGPPPQAQLWLHPDPADGPGAAGEGGDAAGILSLPAGRLEGRDPGHVRRASGQREGEVPGTLQLF